MATLAAKHELTQQIFTKTMGVQVWKPEHERTGRHFVYTTRYVRFFLLLLYELNDRAGIEALGRQIRKKSRMFFKHASLWHEACMTHLKVRILFPPSLYPIEHAFLTELPSSSAPIPASLKTSPTLSSKTSPTTSSSKTPTASKHGPSSSLPHLHPLNLPPLLRPRSSSRPPSKPCAKPSSSRKQTPTS